MTLGRTLWAIILIKLFIMFFILKLFFFPSFLKEKTELSEAETVSEESSLKDAESQDAQKVTEKKDSEQTKQEE